MAPATTDPAQQLRDAGLRVTAQRLAVLEVLRDEGGHLKVDEILERARRRVPRISTQGVYNALADLAGAGLVRRIEPAGSPALHEARAGDNHHHLVCRSCGRVVDVACAVGAAPCLAPSDTAGFALDEAEVTWWGLCPDCQRGMGRDF